MKTYAYGRRSKIQLATCHPDLQRLLKAVMDKQIMDLSVLEGRRGQVAQDAAYALGKSKLKFPRGKHNKNPSLAVDVVPYPIDWSDIARFKQLGELIKETAKELDIAITWGALKEHGGDWNSFNDMPHFELKDCG